MMYDETFMKIALVEAKQALNEDEVPVGAAVVRDGMVLSAAHNIREAASDPTAHAEILALRAAANKLGSWRLSGCTLYVTLEPCAMCAGACVNARIQRIVFGAFDERAGCCGSVADITDNWFNHSVEVVGGICEEECSKILKAYFADKRQNKQDRIDCSNETI
ncbi:MAG: tRNA-specific adenosine deaminase [Firmicutes bacterium ADurb.Bin182]|nr:MAG: tRNA-specific adenosine deaminase [Firmicutes bacterium ADurb.Bin182]